ncbi:hypothetical protein QAD02_005896 [Eretmocerus hayati]|uniref:Uncharacterized protein n=1 Tax=Eretmocerus hayati TaxID=131215 RepID=A0ACC2N1R5_9HYME|nr:hypothetical protein QAD02_005896 [Eretmocerus hayati]
MKVILLFLTLCFSIMSVLTMDPPRDVPFQGGFPEWNEICRILRLMEQTDPDFRTFVQQILPTRTSASHRLDQCRAEPNSTPTPEEQHNHDLWTFMRDLVTNLVSFKYELEILQGEAAVAPTLEREFLESYECQAGPSTSNGRADVLQETLDRIKNLSELIEEMERLFQELFIHLISYQPRVVVNPPATEETNVLHALVTGETREIV